MDDCVDDNQGVLELLDFIGQKKKKKVRFIMDANYSEIKKNLKNMDDLPIGNVDNVCNDPETDLNFDLPKKKKKRKSKTEVLTEDAVDSSTDIVDSLTQSMNGDAEYAYEDLLSRVFTIMLEKDPNRDAESTKKLVMKPPQVIRIGTKKSSFVNFLELCRLLHRLPQHVQSFLLVELGTSGSIDGNNQLIIKGRFEQKQIENVLRRYIKEYVSCHTCRSPDTMLQKDTRLFFLQCESCGARCSVASIKAGFQAVTSKRAAMRAKAN